MHVRAFRSGIPVAALEAAERRAETIQVFASNPRQWKVPAVNEDSDRLFVRELRSGGVRPVFIHLPYLVNLASPNAKTRRFSLKMLEWTLERAYSLKAAGVVVHAGQAGASERVRALRRQANALKRLLGSDDNGPACVFELTAGGRGAIASKLFEATQLLDACDGHKRLRICVDTCHLHAAGYEIDNARGVNETFELLDDEVGLKRLILIHSNDSRDQCGSRRDRHWHIGEGQIGIAGFRAIINHPRLRNVPLVCETPGEVEDDRRNVARLKALRRKARNP